MLEKLQEHRAALKLFHARVSAAARSARITSKWRRSNQTVRQRARCFQPTAHRTIDVCARLLPVYHFVSVTGRITYRTFLERALKRFLFGL